MKKRADPEIITEGLEDDATTQERFAGLIESGMSATAIREALGVTDATVRNWFSGNTTPRSSTLRKLDDLRTVMRFFIGNGVPPERAASWVQARWREYPHERPIEIIGERPEEVLAKAVEDLDLLSRVE